MNLLSILYELIMIKLNRFQTTIISPITTISIEYPFFFVFQWKYIIFYILVGRIYKYIFRRYIYIHIDRLLVPDFWRLFVKWHFNLQWEKSPDFLYLQSNLNFSSNNSQFYHQIFCNKAQKTFIFHFYFCSSSRQ